MPTLSGKTVLAAGATVQNVFLGSQYEFAPFDATIEVAVMSDRATTSLALFSGPDVLQEPGGQAPFGPTLGTQSMPRYPDDYHWEDEVAKGDRLELTLVNGEAAAIATVNWALKITPA